MTSLYIIKTNKRKKSISDLKCFELCDENKKNIGMVDCDAIRIECNGEKNHSINVEVADGMIHVWSIFSLEFELFINTLIIRFKEAN